MFSLIIWINCEQRSCRILGRAGRMALGSQQVWWPYWRSVSIFCFQNTNLWFNLFPSHFSSAAVGTSQSRFWKVTVSKKPLCTQIIYPLNPQAGWYCSDCCDKTVWHLETTESIGEEQVVFSYSRGRDFNMDVCMIIASNVMSEMYTIMCC